MSPACSPPLMVRVPGSGAVLLGDQFAPFGVHTFLGNTVEDPEISIRPVDEVKAYIAAARLVGLPEPSIPLPGHVAFLDRLLLFLGDGVAPEPASRVAGDIVDDL